MAFRITIKNGEHSTTHTNPMKRGNRPLVSSTKYPSVIVNVYKEEYNAENDGEDYENTKIQCLDVEINGQRFSYVKDVNQEEIQRNITIEKLACDYKDNLNADLPSPYHIRFIVVDNAKLETFSDYFSIY